MKLNSASVIRHPEAAVRRARPSKGDGPWPYILRGSQELTPPATTAERPIRGSNGAGRGLGQNRGDVAFQHLLHQIEGIQDLAYLRDASVAKSVKRRHVELHDPVIAALAEEGADMRRDLVALGNRAGQFIAHAGIAAVDGAPHLAEFGLAMAMAHMRQDIDRRGGDEIDIVGAARQRALDVAGIERVEKVHHALAVEILWHVASPPVLDPTRIHGSIVDRMPDNSYNPRMYRCNTIMRGMQWNCSFAGGRAAALWRRPCPGRSAARC